MQKAKKGNAVLAIGLTAALALGSAGLASTAYANENDQDANNPKVQNVEEQDTSAETEAAVETASVGENKTESKIGNWQCDHMIHELLGIYNPNCPFCQNDRPDHGEQQQTIEFEVKGVYPNSTAEVDLGTIKVSKKATGQEVTDALETAASGFSIPDGYELASFEGELGPTWSKDAKLIQTTDKAIDYCGSNIKLNLVSTSEPEQPVEPVVTEYSVTFNDGLESTPDKVISVEEGDLIDQSSIPGNPVCDGYTFEGWYTLDENKNYSENPFNFKNTTIDSDLTLYAKWTKNSDDQGEENPVVPGEDTENGNQDTTNLSGTTNNDASDEAATTDEASELPQTGDSTLPFAAGAAALAGAAAVAGATAMRKRNSSK